MHEQLASAQSVQAHLHTLSTCSATFELYRSQQCYILQPLRYKAKELTYTGEMVTLMYMKNLQSQMESIPLQIKEQQGETETTWQGVIGKEERIAGFHKIQADIAKYTAQLVILLWLTALSHSITPYTELKRCIKGYVRRYAKFQIIFKM